MQYQDPQPQLISFGQLIRDYQFEVPPFQRRFEWGSKDISRIWDDILASIEGDEIHPYFVGTIICLDPRDSRKSLTIIDGQQRLLTFTLFCIVIRNQLRDLQKNKKLNGDQKDVVESLNKEAEEILYRVKRTEKGPIGVSYHPRLLPSHKSREIWLTILQSKEALTLPRNREKIDSFAKKYLANLHKIELLFNKAYKVEHGSIEGSRNDEHLKRIDKLFNAFKNLQFILIRVFSESQVYKMFQGLNATGIELAAADLVKSATIGAVSQKGENRDYIEKTWDNIETLFSNRDKLSLINTFLRHQWISENGYVTGSKLFDEIKNNNLKDKSERQIKDYVTRLKKDAEIYLSIRTLPIILNWVETGLPKSELAKELENFLLLRIDQVYEVILSLINKFIEHKDFAPSQLLLALKKLWSFCFRASINGVSPSEYEKTFAKVCKEISNCIEEKSILKTLEKFYEELTPIAGDNEDFIKNFGNSSTLEYVPNGDNNLIKYVLIEIIGSIEKNIETKRPTIDHILPQNISKWKNIPENAEQLVHKIGNLTILNSTDNSNANDDPLLEKAKSIYAGSAFIMNRELSEEKIVSGFLEDPERAINERAKRYSEIAVKIFCL